MSRKWFSILALIAAATFFSSLSSCGFNKHLVSIQVLPTTVLFGGVGAEVQFKAIGTYDHPPGTKDVTTQATWSIDSQNLVSFSSTPGLVKDINDCGTGNVMASIEDSPNDVFGTAFVAAAGVGTPACTQAVLTVVVAGMGSVTSAPTGITCPSGACSAAFPLDSTVGLNATPGAGATTVTWTWPVNTAGCTPPSASSCTVVLDTNQTITATFQLTAGGELPCSLSFAQQLPQRRFVLVRLLVLVRNYLPGRWRAHALSRQLLHRLHRTKPFYLSLACHLPANPDLHVAIACTAPNMQ